MFSWEFFQKPLPYCRSKTKEIRSLLTVSFWSGYRSDKEELMVYLGYISSLAMLNKKLMFLLALSFEYHYISLLTVL